MKQQRFSKTGIEQGESVVFLLNSFMENNERKESEEEEKYLDVCVKSALSGHKAEYQIISSKEFRKTFFPDTNFENVPRSEQSLIQTLKNEAVHKIFETSKLRYIVSVDIETSNTNKESDFNTQILTSSFVKQWTRISNFHAIVIDAKLKSKSGEFLSSSTGRAGYVVPILIILPLPPVPWFSMTENESCSAMGKAIHNFILSNDDP